MSPHEIKNVIDKVLSTGNHDVLVTERGVSFGYNNLVADMRSLAIMREFGYPVIFDSTHSVQLPGGQGTSSGGQRQFVSCLSRAATAVGIDALFLEVHHLRRASTLFHSVYNKTAADTTAAGPQSERIP